MGDGGFFYGLKDTRVHDGSSSLFCQGDSID